MEYEHPNGLDLVIIKILNCLLQVFSHRLAQPEVSKDTLLRLEEMFRQQPE